MEILKTQFDRKLKTKSFVSSNRFEVIEESEEEVEQVFHKRPDAMAKDIATILKKMIDMETRLDSQEKKILASRSDNKNWINDTQYNPTTQELQELWDSQRENETQRSGM